MSGEQLSAKQQLAEFEKILNEYTDGIGLNRIQHNSEVSKILTLSRKELNGMDPEDCGECSFILSQYSSYIRKEHNRQRVRVHWAEKKLANLIARESSKYGFGGDKARYTKYELLKGTIVAADGAAKVLDNIQTHAKAREIELEGLATEINTMAKALIELQQTKRYRR